MAKVCCVGSGNWGSAIARIAGQNAAKHDCFNTTLNMWTFEEMIEGKKLTEIINETHENVKYLPGIKLPENVVAVPDLVEAARDADLFIFVIPHQFIGRTCKTLKDAGVIKPTARGITLIKGIETGGERGMRLISEIITEELPGMRVSALMGANIAKEVALDHFCETSIGCENNDDGALFKKLFDTPNFRCTVVNDPKTVEICGALKNIVATGAGFCDGLGLGDNTKAAVIRLGLKEMIKFSKLFFGDVTQDSTFFESCGVADLVTTCYGGRNRKCAEEYARTGKSLEEIEIEILNGQKLQGPPTAAEVQIVLKAKGVSNPEEEYPLFTAIDQICYHGKDVKDFIKCLQNHPEHN